MRSLLSASCHTKCKNRAQGTGERVGEKLTGGPRSLQDQGASKGTPLYVVARTDIVRIFVDVSETEANGVGPGSPATVRIPAVDTEEITATVTRLLGSGCRTGRERCGWKSTCRTRTGASSPACTPWGRCKSCARMSGRFP